VIAALVAGLLAGYGIAMPVGAVAAYLVALTARTSLRTGVFAALGVATADGVYALIAVCGGAALAPVLRAVTLHLRRGSAVLIALAVHGTVAAVRRHRERRDGTGACRTASGADRAYLGMWGMTTMNPLTVVYFTALCSAGRRQPLRGVRVRPCSSWLSSSPPPAGSWSSPAAGRFSAGC